MTKPKKRSDLNVTAFRTLQAVTGSPIPALDDAAMRKRIMQEMGRRGGKKGGKARASALSAAERTQIAKAAAAARWKVEGKKPGK